jgi:hypothetical protein
MSDDDIDKEFNEHIAASGARNQRGQAMSDTAWPQDRLRNLIDGLDNVRIALQNEASVVQYGPEYFAQFTPAEAYELADIVIRAADFLREFEAIIRAEAKP